MSKRVLLRLTDEQAAELEPLFLELETDGAVMCQAWRDGIVATVLSPEEAEKVGNALNKPMDYTSSAVESFNKSSNKTSLGIV